MIGVGITIGNAVGAIVAGGTASKGSLPYVVLAALVLVIVGGFVLVNRDESSTHLPRQRTSRQGVPPRLLGRPPPAPRLRVAFGSRFLMVIGFYGAQTYGLYILRDYIGLSDAESNSFAATMGVVLLVGVLLSALVSGWLSDRVGRRKPFIVWSSVVMSIALAIPLFVPTDEGRPRLRLPARPRLRRLHLHRPRPHDRGPARPPPGREQRRSRPGHPRPRHDAAPGDEPVDRRGPGHPHRRYPVLFVAGIVFVMLGAVAVRPIKAVR